MTNFNPAFLNTYAPPEILFVKGEGSKLYDSSGKAYLDLLAGIAVVSVGHNNPAVTQAISKQAGELTHLSNLFFTEPSMKLADKLKEITGWGKVFFANSGAEANECAIKLARKWAGPGRYKMLCAHQSFHGRTLGTLPSTGQPAKWKGFEPLGDAYIHLDFNDLSQFEAAVKSTPKEELAAIWVEPIQGEGGIVPGTKEFLFGLRKLCDENNLALIFDEVQCGMARTGTWWAFQGYGVEPDIFTSAKALGNGLPIGACIAKEEFDVFVPGDHASTFGGSPIPSAAALATIEYIESENLLEKIPAKEKLFREEFSKLPHVSELRGKGLMLACVLDEEKANDVCTKALELGLILNAVRPSLLRLTPALTISDDEIKESAKLLAAAIKEAF